VVPLPPFINAVILLAAPCGFISSANLAFWTFNFCAFFFVRRYKLARPRRSARARSPATLIPAIAPLERPGGDAGGGKTGEEEVGGGREEKERER
jgi:hypothetical protein